MKRKQFAIYTACIGGYDSILQPETVDSRFDYFLFTDEVVKDKVGIWQVRHVDYTNSDKIRIARYVKTHPEELLPEYEATLWMDANLQIASSWVYSRFFELFDQKECVASVRHPERDCIYDEAYTVSTLAYPWPFEHDHIAMSWLHKIWKDNYPRHNGLFETNVLFRRNDAQIKTLDDYWWGIIDFYSKRDQLSFNYALWKLNIKAEYFLPQGGNCRDSSHFRYYNHSSASNRKHIDLGFWELLRYRLYHVSPKMEERSKRHWHIIYRLVLPTVALWLWGFMFGILYSPVLMKNIIVHRLKK